MTALDDAIAAAVAASKDIHTAQAGRTAWTKTAAWMQTLEPTPPPTSTMLVGSNAYPGEETAALAFSAWQRWDRGTPPAGAKVCGLIPLDATSPLAHSPIVEVDNEPYYQGVDTTVWTPKAVACAKAVRAVNATAKILCPLLVQTNTGDYDQGGKWTAWVTLLTQSDPTWFTHFDGFAIHPYPNAGADAWTGSVTEATLGKVRGQLTALGAAQPFYATEWGWDANKTTPQNDATYTKQILDALTARGDVAGAFRFSLVDGHDGNYGLLRVDGSQKPAYPVVKGYVKP